MFEPVIHYLIEAVRVCAVLADLTTASFAGWLIALVSLFVGGVALRARTRR